MKKGQIVKCVNSKQPMFTVGKEYVILAGHGDVDFRCGGYVSERGMIILDDNHEGTYCVFPECLFGEWEVVS